MGYHADQAVSYFIRQLNGRRDRKRKKQGTFDKCKICGKTPLYLEELDEGMWYLCEFDDETNELVRHNCKLDWSVPGLAP